MKTARFAMSVCLAALVFPSLCLASVEGDPRPTTTPRPAVTDIFNLPPVALRPEAVSSSDDAYVALPDAPGRMTSRAAASAARPDLLRSGMKPFSAVGIAVKVGIAGIGFEVATPLSTKWNLRGSASFFSYNVNTTTSDGYIVGGDLKLKTVNVAADWFAFGGSFRLSPGVTIYNGNALSANVTIPGGSSFDLGDATYTSYALDPVKGTLGLSFGNKVAPSLTAGFGNLVPRGLGKHWSVPFEFGVEFIGAPKFTLALSGTACQQGQPVPAGCAPVATDPQTQANIAQENRDLDSDVSPLRAYPIVSIGVGYKF